ncbi:MAG: ribonuclease Z [Tetragenococcus halophilus]|uniref:Ribonuclease Z n=1 Tax=Tetragenococcus halophilus TaxID=51669 RepID=A0AB37D157_TETHA|nr:ribonuclease Z [Tetragenococcus halophilus]MCF1601199.1 ribonuclease Z [Tetragenococcus halophilus]MCO8284866.1 ribonuclease Z [Tetragenococcus halophilus]MCO8285744.1 ribonuclease Z [Tetragenococcus halophilus]MDN5830427.1 ribonuclease Z [Tetragenococcus halophilus]MDN6111880.1 ribonuclease Z [Tetragenococcus halophilus]
MELEFLGTGAGLPAKHRNVTSIALRLLAERNAIWLFDCGEGTQMQILHTTIKPRKIEKIFISHLHGDHIFGLPGLITSRSNQAGDKPLEIYGPKGIEDFIRTSLKISKTHLNYPLKFIEISSDEETLFEDDQFVVTCKRLDHGVASFGFRVTEKDHKGELQVEKLKALGVKPGPIYGKLKQGESVTLTDGQTINGKDFVGQAKKGRVVTILGDTRYTANAIALAEDADVLVHESTFNKHEAKLAKAYYHSTTQQAATVAKKARVNQLILTHISARYLNKDTIELEKEAREVFPHTVIARDFYCMMIPFQEREENQ